MTPAAPFVGYHGGLEQFAPGQMVECAVAAETAGFDGVSLSDHFHPWQDDQGHAGQAWITLAAIGQRTERVALGTSVTCPIYRYHPAQVAHAFATLAVLHPGRIFLSVGTGEAVNELAAGGGWGRHRERAERLAEAIRLIRLLWEQDWVDFEGAFYRVQGAKLYDRPEIPPPLYVASAGLRSAGVAGREGDGWITDANTVRHGQDVRAAYVAAAEGAGKDVTTMPLLTELYAVVGSQDDALEAARRWQFLPAGNELVNVSDPREVERLARGLNSLEDVVGAWVVSEDPDEHVAAIRELAELGVTQVFIHPTQENQRAVIDFYGRHVLPALRGR